MSSPLTPGNSMFSFILAANLHPGKYPDMAHLSGRRGVKDCPFKYTTGSCVETELV